MEMTTLSIVVIIILACVIFGTAFKNMLLQAQLKGVDRANAGQQQRISNFQTYPNMNASSTNAGILLFASCTALFFGYIALSIAW